MGNEEVIPYDGKTRNLPYVILWWFLDIRACNNRTCILLQFFKSK